MAVEPRFLLDTNILLWLSKKDDLNYPAVRSAVETLVRRGCEICFTAQNIFELWNVCTRPVDRNGFGLSVSETNGFVVAIERTLSLLPDDPRIYPEWRRLVLKHHVRGVQVHDAHLAAAMHVHGVSRVLTFNRPDFSRYTDIQVVHPEEIRG